MKYRKLRIAWSVGWGLLGVLLIVMWVRSLTKFEYAQGVVFPRRMPNGRIQATYLTIHSFDHVLSVIWTTDRTRSEFPPWRYASRSWQAKRESWKLTYFFYDGNLGGKQYQSPYWLLVATAGALLASPWIPISKRFSLRTLLIGMTVVAALLGLIIALSR